MPSQAHAVLVNLFRQSTSLTLDLLRTAGVEVGGWQPTIGESTLPVTSSDYHVDLAVHCNDEHGSRQLLALVEIQLRVSEDKLRSWPLYQAAARAQYNCDACVLVVALKESVARWARTPISLGPGGSVFRAIVFGPSDVPRRFERPTPELLLLSALAHGKTDPATLDAAITAIAPLEDAQQSRAYFDLLRYHVKGALDRALERLMATTEHKYLSDFARKYYDEGEAQGEAKGEARGEARGEAKGKASALLQILAARGLEIPDDARARVLGCLDLAQLDAWLARAVTATSVAEVLTA
jgi:hypothetical protein